MTLPIQRVRPARIAGVVSCVPPTTVDNVALGLSLGLAHAQRLVEAIGVRERRVADASLRLSQLAVQAADHLLGRLGWSRMSVDGIILITQTPDRRIPATACHLHRRLELGSHCFAFDVNLGCSAYPYGLWMAQKLMDPQSVRRVLLVVGDFASRSNDPVNPGAGFLFGDAVTVTALECLSEPSPDAQDDLVILGTDGRGEQAILLPDHEPLQVGDGGEHLCRTTFLRMDGQQVASFAIDIVPRIISSLNVAVGGDGADSCCHEYYLLHQANAQLLGHIALKLKIPAAAMPINMSTYGNTAAASIPLLISTSLASALQRPTRVAMIGFGTGLSWSAISKVLDPFDVVDCIEFCEDD